MFSNKKTWKSTENFLEQTERLKKQIETADGILIGAGAGLSASAGFLYDGARFQEHFSDFIEAYRFPDMYSGGFYPFETPEEHWAYWSRYIFINRYTRPPRPVYAQLLELVRDKDYFVLTTNVDHQFQQAGFDKTRMFYMQGDFGLFQCSKPCHSETYDNESVIRQMVQRQTGRMVPSELIPHCPKCGAPMSMNLRADDTFVEDAGWHRAAQRYQEYLRNHEGAHMLYWELGVGGNTPGWIKYPFWRMTFQNPRAVYACVNQQEAFVPKEIEPQSIVLGQDIGGVLRQLLGDS